MLILTIDLASPDKDVPSRIEVSLHPGYGTDAETASQLLELAIGADWPLVIDASGRLVRIPKGQVEQFFVRAVGGSM